MPDTPLAAADMQRLFSPQTAMQRNYGMGYGLSRRLVIFELCYSHNPDYCKQPYNITCSSS